MDSVSSSLKDRPRVAQSGLSCLQPLSLSLATNVLTMGRGAPKVPLFSILLWDPAWESLGVLVKYAPPIRADQIRGTRA